MDINDIIAKVEYTNLKPTATEKDIEALCQTAVAMNYLGVCVAPAYAGLALDRLKWSGLKVVSVVGFPLGYSTPLCKAREAGELADLGVDEIDAVINVGQLLSGRENEVFFELNEIKRCAGRAKFKVILETCYLESDERITTAAKLALDAGADFLKTSTGFGPYGATEAHVRLLAKLADGQAGVKAAGGIRDLDTAARMILAGADRIGTSAQLGS